MPKMYSFEFKQRAIRLFILLKPEGIIVNKETGAMVHSVDELSEYLGIARSTLKKWRKTIKLEFPKKEVFINA